MLYCHHTRGHPVNLATCSYSEFRPAMGTPVRTTVGAPRYRLPYSLEHALPALYPTRSMLRLPRHLYEPQYLARLRETTAPVLQQHFLAIAEVSENESLVLLCFDKLSKPAAWCHRTMFATWWTEETGEVVPELGACDDRASTLFR